MQQRLARRSRLMPALLGAVALTAPLFAQTFRGGVRGAVTDSSGAIVPARP